jgi:hypothetical protein
METGQDPPSVGDDTVAFEVKMGKRERVLPFVMLKLVDMG